MKKIRTSKSGQKKSVKVIVNIISVIFWICLWQAAAVIIDEEVFLPAPFKVVNVLINKLIISREFWISVMGSIANIGLGLLGGVLAGIFIASLSFRFNIVRIFVGFPIKVIKSIPVASFVILVLLWIPSSGLSVLIPFLVVLPIIYINTLSALLELDFKLIEMADVFHVSVINRVMYIYIPHIMPYFLSACSLAVGMAWKSGIAAEIIGLTKGSIGNELYKSKIYLMTTELFAWTFVIAFISIIFEIIIKFAAYMIDKRLG